METSIRVAVVIFTFCFGKVLSTLGTNTERPASYGEVGKSTTICQKLCN